jgi:hypothetical protein
MSPSQSLSLRFALSVASSAATLAALCIRKLRLIPQQTFNTLVIGIWVASRFGLFALAFLLLGMEPRGDIRIYSEIGALVLQGRLPYRDFICSYAPLFPFLSALSYKVSHTGLAMIFFAIMCEGAVLLLWLKMAREWFSEERMRIAALLFITSAIEIQYIAIDGQNNIIVAVLLSLAIFFISRNRSLLSGFCLGFGIALVKFLPVLYAPAFLPVYKARWRWLIGMAVGCVPIYAIFSRMHLPITQPLQVEGAMRSAGNLPFLFEAVTGYVLPGVVYTGILFASFLLIFWSIWRVIRDASTALRMQTLCFGISAITIALVLFSKKSWPPYLVLTMFPMCFAPTISRLNGFPIVCFNIVAILESSVWATFFGLHQAPEIHAQMLQHVVSVVPLLACELLLILGYFWLIYEMMRGLHHCHREMGATTSSQLGVATPTLAMTE